MPKTDARRKRRKEVPESMPNEKMRKFIEDVEIQERKMKKGKPSILPWFLALLFLALLFSFSVKAEAAELPSADAVLADGVYTISSKLDPVQVLDIAANSWHSGANLQIYSSNGTDAQKFVLTGLGNGVYSIFSFSSGHSLDIAGAGTANGANVEQYYRNGTDAQRFYIRDAGNGYCVILPLCSGLAVDVAGGGRTSGTNVWTYAYNGTDAQLFKFTKAASGAALTGGTYLIHSGLNDSRVLTVDSGSNASGANISIRSNTMSDAQYITVTPAGNGSYLLSPVCSSLSFDAENGASVNGTNVRQYSANGTAAQKWIIKENGSGWYTIASALGNNMTLDVAAAQTAEGTNVQLYESNDSRAQAFSFEKTDAGRNMPDGCYTFRLAADESKVLDIAAASRKNGGNVQLYASNDTNAQKFNVQYAGNGFYTIKNAHSGKAVDVDGGQRANGTNVQQYEANGTAAQKWSFLLSDDGNDFSVVTALDSAKVLDVCGGNSSNGTNIWIYERNGTSAQKWKLTPAVAAQEPPESSSHLIAIDAGHQLHSNTGTEPIGPGSSIYKQKVASGTSGNWSGLNEYELNLEVSLKLRDELISRGYSVYMIRTTNDVNISNAERARLATQAGAEILVRIHANSSENSSVRGVMFYEPSSSNQFLSSSVISGSQRLASLLLNAECAATGLPNKGLLTGDDMTGINWATMPVTIAEMGFMSNRSDDLYMASAQGQAAIVQGIANGIEQYFG